MCIRDSTHTHTQRAARAARAATDRQTDEQTVAISSHTAHGARAVTDRQTNRQLQYRRRHNNKLINLIFQTLTFVDVVVVGDAVD